MPHASESNKSYDVPYGKGSLFSHLNNAQHRTQLRANKLNRGHDAKLAAHNAMIHRNKTAELDRRDKASRRMHQHIQELLAYQKVLEDFRVENFVSIERGFSKRQIFTPRTFQRYKFERKVMINGFSVQSLYPYVIDTIENSAPERKREAWFRRQLDKAKQRSNFLIDKKLTNQAIEREREVNLLQSESRVHSDDKNKVGDNTRKLGHVGDVTRELEELKKVKYRHSETVLTVHKHISRQNSGFLGDNRGQLDKSVSSNKGGLKPLPVIVASFKR